MRRADRMIALEKIVGVLKKKGNLTAVQVSQYSGVNKHTTRKLLGELTYGADGYAVSTKRSSGQHYTRYSLI